jgi:5-formyltetrahydrofolate cyclo-ligase
MEAPETLALKAAMRREAALCRQAAYHGFPDAGSALARHLRDHVSLPRDCAVSGYWPLPEEMDVKPSLRDLHATGHRIGLPVVVGRAKPLVFREWRPGMDLVVGNFNVHAPPPDSPEIVPQVLLVPMLAFDLHGYRLGYGGGFYDRTLRKLREAAEKAASHVLVIGIAYAAQQVAEVPRGPYDQPLDWIATEKWARPVAGSRLEQG